VIAARYLVDDVDSAVAFYTDRLGFVLDQQYGPAMAIVVRDGFALWLAGPVSSAAQPMPDGRTPTPGGWNRVVLVVDDLDPLVASLTESATTFRNAPFGGVGGRQVLIEDPSGNPIELFEGG